jgi:transcriptional regulator with XRE-family HTH domain
MPTRQPTKLGAEILRLMAARNIHRQSELAEAARVSPSTISRLIFSEEITPDMRTFERLADALGVRAPDLMAHYDTALSAAAVDDQPLPPELADLVRIYRRLRSPDHRADLLERTRWVVEWGLVLLNRERPTH